MLLFGQSVSDSVEDACLSTGQALLARRNRFSQPAGHCTRRVFYAMAWGCLTHRHYSARQARIF